MQTGFEFSKEAAKPKREANPDDSPTHESMRAGVKLNRNPSTDQKKVRHQMARQQKTAALTSDDISEISRSDPNGMPEYPSDEKLRAFDDWIDATYGPGSAAEYHGWGNSEDTLDNPGAWDNHVEYPLDDYDIHHDASKQGASMNTNAREAELLNAMAKASLADQRELAIELEELRAQRRASIQQDRDVSMADTVIRDHLTPVFTHSLNTTATDWLDEVTGSVTDLEDAERKVVAEATIWFNRTSAEVKADREEFGEQAMGMARRVASSGGEAAPALRRAFLDRVAFLHKQADIEPLPDSAPGLQQPDVDEWTTQLTTGEGSVDDDVDVVTDRAAFSSRRHSTLRSMANDSPGQVDEDQSGNAESTITDYDTDADQDPFLFEDWPEDEDDPGYHPPMPGAGEQTSASLRVAAYNPFSDPESFYNKPNKGPHKGTPDDLFPDGVPLHGDLTPEQQAWLDKGKRRSSRRTAADGDFHSGKVKGARSLEEVQAYMPSNYTASQDADGNIWISGRDSAGWTWEDYVKPRLGSGLMGVEEADTEGQGTTWASKQAASEDYLEDATHVCKYCGDPIMKDDEFGWVDCINGDNGGTYDYCPDAPGDDMEDKKHSPGGRYEGSRRVVANTCADCGALIERDPAGETNRSWHHNDGSKHDHEAKPSSKESVRVGAKVHAVCDICGKDMGYHETQEEADAALRTHKANQHWKESRRVQADDSGNGQNGNADSKLEVVEVGNPNDVPPWPWEMGLVGDETGDDAADVGSVPTPGQSVDDYPQPKGASHTAAMPNVDDIIAWENGEMDEDEEAEFFQGLIDSGMAWQLQGVYGRTAQALIDAGVCHPAGTEAALKTADDSVRLVCQNGHTWRSADRDSKCPTCGEGAVGADDVAHGPFDKSARQNPFLSTVRSNLMGGSPFSNRLVAEGGEHTATPKTVIAIHCNSCGNDFTRSKPEDAQRCPKCKSSDLRNQGFGRTSATDFIVPDNVGARDMDPNVLAQQIGRMNILSISGGRVFTISKSGRPCGISLPVSNGYVVNVFLANDDTYTVQRVFRGVVKGERTNVYAEEVGEAAYNAGMFRSNEFGGHGGSMASKTADWVDAGNGTKKFVNAFGEEITPLCPKCQNDFGAVTRRGEYYNYFKCPSCDTQFQVAVPWDDETTASKTAETEDEWLSGNFDNSIQSPRIPDGLSVDDPVTVKLEGEVWGTGTYQGRGSSEDGPYFKVMLQEDGVDDYDVSILPVFSGFTIEKAGSKQAANFITSTCRKCGRKGEDNDAFSICPSCGSGADDIDTEYAHKDQYDRWGESGKKQAGVDGYEGMSDEAVELELFAMNDYDSYRQSYEPVVKNLQKFFQKGQWDRDLAIQGMMHFADVAAQNYIKENGSSGDEWHQVFSVPVRREMAESLVDQLKAELDLGNFISHKLAGSHDPIAYTYEADYHCPECTEARFGRGPDGFIAEDAVDNEGNPVGVLAPWDEWQQFDGEHETLACGTCGRVIEEYDPS